MANATALGMKSLAVHMEEDGATNDAIEVAFTAVQGLRPKDESDVDYRESQPNLSKCFITFFIFRNKKALKVSAFPAFFIF